MSPVHVFFFRGLSTYGHDHAKWSFFDFGPVYKHLAREFAQRQVRFYPVLNMGAGPLVEVAARARKFLDHHPVFQDPDLPVHFFGHSAGGLVARLVLNSLESELGQEHVSKKVLSLLTAATPHHGATLADIALEMPTRYKGSALLLKSLGYDVVAKKAFFEELTPKGLQTLLPEKNHFVPTASIVCHAPRSEWCPPLKMFYMVKAFNDFNIPSDGVVDRDAQPFGNVIAEVKLDHFRQVGLFGQEKKFKQFCQIISDYFVSAN